MSNDPPLRVPQNCGRATIVCLCGQRLGTEKFQKHLLMCQKMIEALKQSGHATFWLRSSESPKQEKEYFIEEVFGPRMDSFRNSTVIPRWRKRDKRFKGLIYLNDLRSPSRSIPVRCPECRVVFASLRELENHMEETQHGLLQCAEPGCGQHIWPWLGSEDSGRKSLSDSIATHRRRTGHVGFRSLNSTPPRILDMPQYEAKSERQDYDKEQYLCKCGTVYLHKLSLLHHWIVDEKCELALEKRSSHFHFPKLQCCMCDKKGSVVEMHQHMVESLEWGVVHDCFIFPHEEEVTGPYLVDSQSYVEEADTVGLESVVQCPICMLIIKDRSLESAIDQLEKHMNATDHHLGCCGQDGCNEALSLYQNPVHSSSHESEGTKMIGTILDKKAMEVQISHRDFDFPVREEQAHLTFHDMRTAYQCPKLDCLTLFNHAEYLQDHLYQTGHGIWICPDCPATPTFSWLREQCPPPCSCPIPREHCLADKRSPEDFLVVIQDKDIKRFYNHLYSKCPKCETLMDIHADMSFHETSGQCQHFQSLRKSNQSVTSKQVHGLTTPKPVP